MRTKQSASTSIFDPAIVGSASIADALRKLNPRTMTRNPVMFIVEVGSVLTTLLFVRDLGDSTGQENVFAGLVAAWLWFTVLFANFAEAMAEGRGKAQAASAAQDARRDDRPGPAAPTARSSSKSSSALAARRPLRRDAPAR